MSQGLKNPEKWTRIGEAIKAEGKLVFWNGHQLQVWTGNACYRILQACDFWEAHDTWEAGLEAAYRAGAKEEHKKLAAAKAFITNVFAMDRVTLDLLNRL